MSEGLIYFHNGDRVITPLGRVGYVKKQAGDHVIGIYVHSVDDESAEFTIAARCLVSWPPNTERPLPRRLVQ
mgnify:CR=1 FL=1